MQRTLKTLAAGSAALAGAAVVAYAAMGTPTKFVSIDQGVDQATLGRYHFTDQGTRLLPAAWLAAVYKADGSGKLMNTDDLRRFGFIVDDVPPNEKNPYGWPLGWTVSDPAKSDGIAIAGFTCAMCHTGQIDYKGTGIRIEGGQSMIDLFPFVDTILAAFRATAADPARRAKFAADAVANGYPADRMDRDFDGIVAALREASSHPAEAQIIMLPGGHGRVDAVQGIANRVFGSDLKMPENQRDATAPVSYPHLWDIWRLSWLQYNGFMPPQSTSRNIGEVLGTEGQTHIVNDKGELNPEPLRWQSSVQLDNLVWMEDTLQHLKAPTWPADILGPIDQAKAATGKQLFTEHCAGCHGIKELPNGDWDVAVVPLTHIGTDPNQATNWAGYTYDLTKIGLAKDAPAYLGVNAGVNAIRNQLYVDYDTPAADREPDATLLSPCGYKARPLIGVWATPPFLHNGSVRTVFDLLSDPRPVTFRFGTREFDPVNLGYTEDPVDGDMMLDTSVSGNSNQGHWWTDDASRPGRIGPKLADDEKYAIIEFLKAASYDTYPSEKRETPAKVACEDDPDWAIKARLN